MWLRTVIFTAIYAVGTIVLPLIASLFMVVDWVDVLSRAVGLIITAGLCHYFGQRDAMKAFRCDIVSSAQELVSAFRDLGPVDVKLTITDSKSEPTA